MTILLNKFKEYLLADKISSVSIKNYLSDIRKFTSWYEQKYHNEFHPLLITADIIEAYKHEISIANKHDAFHTTRSIKRYSSSLRKLFSFLHATGAIPTNPLQILPKEEQVEIDLWRIKEFKDFLFNDKASRLTIKNYILDVRQFLTWVDEVTKPTTSELTTKDHFMKLDDFIVSEYKNRLLSEAGFSPSSINRKLSSLRRYIAWLNKKGLIQKDIQISDLTLLNSNNFDLKTNEAQQAKTEHSFENLEKLKMMQAAQVQNTLEEKKAYSKFPPLRLVQKISRIATLSIDLLILSPLTNLIEESSYGIWKFKGRKIFAPTQTIFNKPLGRLISASDSKSVILSANLPQILKEFMGMGLSSHLEARRIRGIPKSAYAPLKVSTKSFSLPKKILFYVRHKRPKWYIKYHSYPLVQYFHFAIFLIFMTSVGFGMYQSFFEAPNKGKPVLAALPTSPPRILSFQGRLTDGSNNPIAAATNLRFSIYNNQTSSGSALLWEETQNLSPDQEGIFSALLGKKTMINQSLFANNPSLYLGITVGTDEELQPRQQLATVAYAANADTLQGLVPITQASAGTNNVILALDSSGDLTIGGSATPTFQATGGEFTISGKVLTLTTTAGSNANVQISPDGSGIIDLQKPLQNTSSNNSIGIPPGTVEVADLFAINATSSAHPAFLINQSSSGPLISASASGIAKFTVSNGGDGVFAGKLSVNGDTLSTSATSFYIANSNATTLYLGGAATSLSIGASTGTTTINNALSIIGLLTANGGITIPSGKSLTLEGKINSHLIASTSATYDLGSTSSYWRNAYIDNLFTSSTATTSGFFQRNNGALTPTNTSDDLLLGATTASSAKFGFLNVASGTPIASISATTTGLALSGDGSIQSLRNGTLTLGGSTTGHISFMPGNTTAMTLTANGSVGIGTTSPLSTIDVRGNSSANPIASFSGSTTSAGVVVDNAGSGDIFTAAKSGATKFTISNNGDITVYGTATTCTIGNGTSATSCSSSDRRLKTEISSLTNISGLDAVRQLNPVSYNWNTWMQGNGASEATQYGFIAQDVAAILPNLVSQDKNTGYFKLDYQGLFAPIVKSIQELDAKVSNSTSAIASNITIGGQTLNNYIKSLVNEAISNTQNTLFPAKIISPTGEIGTLKTNLISPLASGSAVAVHGDLEVQGNASISGTLRVKKIIADEIEGLNINASTISATYITNVTNIYNSIATPSATPTPFTEDQNASPSGNYPLAPSPYPLNSSSPSGQLSYTPTLISDFGKFTQGLIALGPTSLTETWINGDLNIGKNMLIGQNAIDTIGSDLNIQSLRQGNINLMGKAVVIDTEGNLNVNGNSIFAKDVSVKGKLAANIIVPVPDQDLIVQLSGTKPNGESRKFEIRNSSGSGVLAINQLGDLIASGSGQFSKIAANALSVVRGAQADTSLTETNASSSAGMAVITANETERTIYSPYVTKDSLIYVTATSNTQGQTPYIARQTANSFTVQIPSSVTKDIKFNWWILN